MYEQLIKNLCNDYFEGEIDCFEDDGQRFAYIAFNNRIATIYETENGVEIIIEKMNDKIEDYEQIDSKIYKRLTAAHNFINKYLN